MPVPSAVMIVLISSLLSILSKRAFSTLRILPLIGRMAWNADPAPAWPSRRPNRPPRCRVAQRGVAFLTIGQLARQAADVERALAAGEVARLAGRLARARPAVTAF